MNLKVFFISFLSLLFFFNQGYGQQEELPQNLTMEDAVNLALKFNFNIEQKTIQTAIALKRIDELKWQKIPDIYASFDMRYNIVVPTTPVPSIAFNPSANKDEILPLKMMTRWRNSAGINANYDLFNPQTFGQLKEAKQKVVISQADKEISIQQLTFITQQDYVACLLAQDQLLLAISDTLNKHELLLVFQDKQTAGRLKVNDLNNVMIEKNEAISTYFEALRILNNTKAQLLEDMGFEADKVEDIYLIGNLLDLYAVYHQKEPSEMKSQTLMKIEQEKTLTTLKLKNTKMTALPKVSLNGFWGTNYFSNQFEIFSSPFWYGNTYLGLNVNVPITTGLDRLKRVESLNLQLKQDELNYKIEELERKKLKVQLQEDLTYRQENLLLKENNKKLRKENLDIDSELLKNGRMTTDEWAKSNLLYLQSSSAFLQAIYDYIIVKIELDRIAHD
ncbi:MAG: TolC family protein [Chitinophagales bacterium]|nr:TolC family protein [Chitinophagales bacterium]